MITEIVGRLMGDAAGIDLDGRELRQGELLETDVCIVGGGPAGIVLAHELAAKGVDVLLLESGGSEAEHATAALNRGRCTGDRYAGLAATRHRQLGGSARIWNTPVGQAVGAKYVPLGPTDLEERDGTPTGWPFRFDVLEPWYAEAQTLCGLGPPAYDAADWVAGEELLDLGDGALVNRVYQLGETHAVVDQPLAALRASGRARICRHATVLRLAAGLRGKVDEAEFAAIGSPRFRVAAETFVLAAGAVENARLLLLSHCPWAPDGLGNGTGWVGSCFMEHPRDHAASWRPPAGMEKRLAFYDARPAAGGTVVAGRLALTDDVLRQGRLPNASATLVPVSAAGPSRTWRRPRRALYPGGRIGWSQTAAAGYESRGFHVLINVEQLPHPDNRVCLGRRRDAFALPRAELQWRWRREDRAGLARVRHLLADAFVEAGLGSVVVDAALDPNPNAHHHAGTTRMSEDPAHGVVDRNGLVHGTTNLYVAGASVFPTAGFANPTLTVVALSLRLARHIAALGRRPAAGGSSQPPRG